MYMLKWMPQGDHLVKMLATNWQNDKSSVIFSTYLLCCPLFFKLKLVLSATTATMIRLLTSRVIVAQTIKQFALISENIRKN